MQACLVKDYIQKYLNLNYFRLNLSKQTKTMNEWNESK